ncbi:MAG TPA: hypothetical protein VMQ54_04715 [Steroidobacteraceae bacterium]|jgi:hypothetical protein|nr:hypothetical protein [Steroidobacteraceae bacterium]
MSHPLATNDQRELEALCLRIAATPGVRAAREQARALLLANPTSRTPDGAAGLDRALDQWVMAGVVAIANNDPSRPRALWAIDNTPREWFGHVFPGAAVAIDNPDNVNRTMPLNGAWEYQVNGRFGKHSTAQTSFIVTPAEEGQLRLGNTIAALTNLDLQADSDGRFAITLDKRPAGGRVNHMQITGGAQMLAIRDSHSDWRQRATEIQVVPMSGPAAPAPVAEDVLARAAAESIVEFVAFWLEFKNTFWKTPPFNQVIGPLGRDGGWGYQAGGRFKLSDDEALVITTGGAGAAYTGFQVSDPWTISPDPKYATTSRNSSQVTANPNGSHTYVISVIDPGVANWIDTAGLHEGWFMLRWQNVKTADPSSLLRSARLVRWTELDAELPPGTPRATLQQRSAEIQRRAEDYESRYK